MKTKLLTTANVCALLISITGCAADNTEQKPEPSTESSSGRSMRRNKPAISSKDKEDIMSTKYVHFTDEQKEQARQTDLYELLRSQGEKLKRSGSEYEWLDGSEKVTIWGNLWFHQYDQQGGDAIDFVRRFYNKDYPEAVEYLLDGCKGTLTVSPPIDRRPPKPFELPPRNDNIQRVYVYLLSRRGLDRDVVYTFAHRQMIYESAQYHNAVFVGFDQHGIPRHANMRGTGSESTFKGNADSSIPEYSFHWTGRSKYLLLFEAPIDMLSFISMHKKNW